MHYTIQVNSVCRAVRVSPVIHYRHTVCYVSFTGRGGHEPLLVASEAWSKSIRIPQKGKARRPKPKEMSSSA